MKRGSWAGTHCESIIKYIKKQRASFPSRKSSLEHINSSISRCRLGLVLIVFMQETAQRVAFSLRYDSLPQHNIKWNAFI